MDTVAQPRFALYSRLLDYSLVNSFVSTTISLIDYAKSSSSLVQKGIETVQPVLNKLDDISHQATIDSILSHVDHFGCRQLDKIEEGAGRLKSTVGTITENAKPYASPVVEFGKEKLSGSLVEKALVGTVVIVDNVVDHLLPPQPGEAVPQQLHHDGDPSLLERTGPVINKIRNRVSKESILRLPGQTYSELKGLAFRTAEDANLSYCVDVLTQGANKMQTLSSTTQAACKSSLNKGREFSVSSVDYIHSSLDYLVRVAGQLFLLLRNIDPTEARISAEQLAKMVHDSKLNVLSAVDNSERLARLRADAEAILRRISEEIIQLVNKQRDKATSSDNAAIKLSVNAMAVCVQAIMAAFITITQGFHAPTPPVAEQHAAGPSNSHAHDELRT